MSGLRRFARHPNGVAGYLLSGPDWRRPASGPWL